MWKLLVGAVLIMGSQNISHERVDNAKQKIVQKIQERGDLPYATVDRQLGILDSLSEFDMGRFLIERGGIDGYWTHYIVTYPQEERPGLSEMQRYLLEKIPVALATQERYQIFKREIQKHVAPGCTLASIPSGVMGDLLELDFSNAHGFTLVGIDIDEESFELAKDLAEEKGLESHCRFFKKDAWKLEERDSFDLIASNGLSIYEPSEEKVVELYRQFHEALKPGGVLVTSFLTPLAEWKMEEVNNQDALMQRLIFFDILESKWQAMRPEAEVQAQLERAGFSEIEVIYDRAHIFPTVVARK